MGWAKKKKKKSKIDDAMPCHDTGIRSSLLEPKKPKIAFSRFFGARKQGFKKKDQLKGVGAFFSGTGPIFPAGSNKSINQVFFLTQINEM